MKHWQVVFIVHEGRRRSNSSCVSVTVTVCLPLKNKFCEAVSYKDTKITLLLYVRLSNITVLDRNQAIEEILTGTNFNTFGKLPSSQATTNYITHVGILPSRAFVLFLFCFVFFFLCVCVCVFCCYGGGFFCVCLFVVVLNKKKRFWNATWNLPLSVQVIYTKETKERISREWKDFAGV